MKNKPVATRHAPALTVAQWRRSPKLRAELQAILELPVLKLALATAAQVATPNIGQPPALVSSEYMNSLALRYAQRSGFGAHLTFLHRLAQAEPVSDKQLQPFGELLDESGE